MKQKLAMNNMKIGEGQYNRYARRLRFINFTKNNMKVVSYDKYLAHIRQTSFEHAIANNV